MARSKRQYSSLIQQERQQRILQEARRSLASHGVASLTLKPVAEASNVALKTLYNIFGNKNGLLVGVVAELLDEVEDIAVDIKSEPGIEQLFAYSESGYRKLRGDQDLSSAMLRILFQTENPELAGEQIGRLRKLAHFSLVHASRDGELVEGVNIDELADVICSNQWGLALMWERGLLSMDELGNRVLLSHCLALIPVCQGPRRQWLEKKVQKYMGVTDEVERI